MNWEANQAEPNVVVPVRRIVPVAVGGPAVLSVVVPTAAAIHAVRVSGRHPIMVYHIFAKLGSIGVFGKFNQWLHVDCELLFRPIAVTVIPFVLSEFLNKAFFASWIEQDFIGEDTIAQEWNAEFYAVELDIPV